MRLSNLDQYKYAYREVYSKSNKEGLNLNFISELAKLIDYKDEYALFDFIRMFDDFPYYINQGNGIIWDVFHDGGRLENFFISDLDELFRIAIVIDELRNDNAFSRMISDRFLIYASEGHRDVPTRSILGSLERTYEYTSKDFEEDKLSDDYTEAISQYQDVPFPNLAIFESGEDATIEEFKEFMNHIPLINEAIKSNDNKFYNSSFEGLFLCFYLLEDLEFSVDDNIVSGRNHDDIEFDKLKIEFLNSKDTLEMLELALECYYKTFAVAHVKSNELSVFESLYSSISNNFTYLLEYAAYDDIFIASARHYYHNLDKGTLIGIQEFGIDKSIANFLDNYNNLEYLAQLPSMPFFKGLPHEKFYGYSNEVCKLDWNAMRALTGEIDLEDFSKKYSKDPILKKAVRKKIVSKSDLLVTNVRLDKKKQYSRYSKYKLEEFEIGVLPQSKLKFFTKKARVNEADILEFINLIPTFLEELRRTKASYSKLGRVLTIFFLPSFNKDTRNNYYTGGISKFINDGNILLKGYSTKVETAVNELVHSDLGRELFKEVVNTLYTSIGLSHDISNYSALMSIYYDYIPMISEELSVIYKYEEMMQKGVAYMYRSIPLNMYKGIREFGYIDAIIEHQENYSNDFNRYLD